MTRQLNSKRRASASGKTKSVIVFLHGYGADGADLLGLADPLAPHLPDTVFVAPDAPEKCKGNPFGYQWFPIPWMDGSSEEAAAQGLARSVEDLNGYLDQVLLEEGIKASQLILVGFSQGTMMSLHVAPRRAESFAAVVGFSGRLLSPENLQSEAVSKPPVLLLHGDQDDMVPFAEMGAAGDSLTAAGFTVYAFVMKGTAHGIAQEGLGAALQFIKENLPRS